LVLLKLGRQPDLLLGGEPLESLEFSVETVDLLA
jgi:hypothetical protein